MKLLVALAIMLGFAPLSHGTISMSITYNASTDTTVFSYSGSWDSFTASGGYAANIAEIGQGYGKGFFSMGSNVIDYYQAGGATVTDMPWYVSENISGTQSGQPLGLRPDNVLYAIDGYVAGQSIVGALTFVGHDFADFSLSNDDSGSFALSGGNTVNWTTSTVPEPTSVAYATGVLVLLFVGRRFRM